MIGREKTIHVKVPGSSANLGPGFDSLGLALPLYLSVRVKRADRDSIKVYGDHLASLPLDSTNLIYQTMSYFYQKENQELPPVAIEIESEIPLSRGLGSSGAAIVAGLLAANELMGSRKSKEEILQYATELEGHADNVAASLFGGLVVTAWDGKTAKAEHFPLTDQLQVLLAIPNYTLSTNTARKTIPETIPLRDAAFNIGHSTLLITYLLTGQYDKIPFAMKDRLHQPYRQTAVKGLERIVSEVDQNRLWGAALSGAGPTLILFIHPNQKRVAKEYMMQIAREEGVEFQLKFCSIENEGAKLEILWENERISIQ
ncbi:homoserine kinase [Tepidibacillus fermentans]|uniref:Homoserine kinase n=1 Tax=Tepidibacillus fermentans TaxID=1281767 RepID=A0A4R3K744_9BACI|nr:homoserine kinase [Tepidibacillus fermentans]TCS78766.1 homoserine kinase [Tepidibacillus fermentans]